MSEATSRAISKERLQKAVNTVAKLAASEYPEFWNLLEAQLYFLDEWLTNDTVDPRRHWQLKKAHHRLRRFRKMSSMTQRGAR